MKHVAIIGGGYCGTLQAIMLLRAGMERVTLIERSPRLARGAAYGTAHASHLLNVRAGRMSAFANEPDDFAVWIEARGGNREDFAQRRIYGVYLEELLDRARAEAGDRLMIVRGDAVDITSGHGEAVTLRDGREVAPDAIILALGNLAPLAPAGIAPERLDPDRYVQDPWRADLAAGLGASDTVLLIGTGLTAIDAALMLDDAGFKGRTLTLSRRGLVPRVHGPPAAAGPPPGGLPADCIALLRMVRDDSRAHGWRAAVDRLRPITQHLWMSASAAERRRFLRHLRPWWDVHRHRIAPAIAARIDRMVEEGRLEFAGGRIAAVTPVADGAEVDWTPRGAGTRRRVLVRRIVNCTGPSGDIRGVAEPLLARLTASGRIRADPYQLGIDVDKSCRTLDVAGATSPSLYAVGPLTRGAFWEMVAVPDLRGQLQGLAGTLTRG